MDIKPGLAALTLHEATLIQDVVLPFEKAAIWMAVENARETWFEQVVSSDDDVTDLHPIKVPLTREQLEEIGDTITVVIDHANERVAGVEQYFNMLEAMGLEAGSELLMRLHRELTLSGSQPDLVGAESPPDSIRLAGYIRDCIKIYQTDADIVARNTATTGN